MSSFSMCGRNLRQRLLRKKRLDVDQLSTPLRRCLHTYHLVFLGIGQMTGAGVYIMTGVVAKQHAGLATFISYIIAGFVSFLSAMCYAEFAARVPRAGSCYSYAYVTIGELFAFIIGWNILLEHCIGAASTSRAWGGSFDSLVGNAISNWTIQNIPFSLNTTWLAKYPDLISPLFLIILCVAVALGANISLNINIVVAIINICFTVIISVLGYYYGKVENWSSNAFAPYGAQGIIVGASMCVYAYIGIDGIAVAGEEAINPSVSIPRANIVALSVVTIIYVAMSTALVTVVPYWSLSLTAPFANAFSRIGYPWVKYVVIVGALIAITCTTLGHAFSAPRTMYSMASDGVIFRFIGYVNKRTQTPLVAIAIFLVIAMVLSILFDLDELADMSSIGTIITFFAVSACVIILRYQPKLKVANEETQLVEMNLMKKDPSAEPSTYPIWNNPGNLKPNYANLPILKDLPPGRGVILATASMSVAMLVLSCVVVLGEGKLANTSWWAILLTLIASLWVMASFALLLLYQQDNQISTYQVPFVPLFPAVSMLLNMALLMSLNVVVWIRLGIWMVAGFLIYFGYGIYQGKENDHQKPNQKTYSSTEPRHVTDTISQDGSSETHED